MYQRKKLDSSGGSAGRTSDLRAIAAGSNGEQVTSTNRACRVTVKIIEAKDLKKHPSGHDARDPSFKLRVEDISHKSREIRDFVDQDGILRVNKNFTFDVKDPKSAQLSVQVYGKGMLGFDELIGACQNMPVKLLLEENDGRVNLIHVESVGYGNCDVCLSEVEAKWYDLYSKDGRKKLPGKILMNIVAGIAEPEQKIHTFVGTWNVGNARPHIIQNRSLPFGVNSDHDPCKLPSVSFLPLEN
eukprot:Gb_20515 [translate_table: standard]